jgi:hypothetical protein
MRARILIGLTVAVLFTIAWACAPVGVEAQELTRTETIGCSGNNCVDIWKIKCASPLTKKICASAIDNGAAFDDVLVVTLVGVTPLALLGKGDIASGAPGATAAPNCLARPGTTIGPISALVTISVTTNSSTTYSATFTCFDKNNVLISTATNPTAVLLTDQ